MAICRHSATAFVSLSCVRLKRFVCFFSFFPFPYVETPRARACVNENKWMLCTIKFQLAYTHSFSSPRTNHFYTLSREHGCCCCCWHCKRNGNNINALETEDGVRRGHAPSPSRFLPKIDSQSPCASSMYQLSALIILVIEQWKPLFFGVCSWTEISSKSPFALKCYAGHTIVEYRL